MPPKTGLKRDTIDKFYTSPECVAICIENFKKYIELSNTDYIIEPSAGNGAFISSIKSITNNYYFYDIAPEHPDILTQDYLTTKFKKGNYHVVGNPPFGRQSSLCKKFIKHSSTFAKSISFILAKSFKKDSMKSCFPLDFTMVCEVDLPSNSFLLNGKPYDVPCIFQIWIKTDVARIATKKLEPIGYSFVKQNENPDISFRRVGVYAGKIDTEIDQKSSQSHYFIKFSNGNSLKKNLKLLEQASFTHDNTVGAKSISKQDIIGCFNSILN
jgi:hypothetical protein